MIPTSACPRLSPGVKLQFDRTRDQWILQAPERVFVLDEVSHEILSRCNGKTSLQVLIEELSTAFEADVAEIAADVDDLLSSLIDKRVVMA